MKRLVFCVTNDLNFDQRMNRCCTALQEAGYKVLLVGRSKKNSSNLINQKFEQHRLNCWFEKGKLFYIEYNIRLFFFLIFAKADAFVAIDLDTVLPVYLASRIRDKKRVYDAHELFCEMKEIVTRPAIYKFWKNIEQWMIPKFPLGYTVNQPIADWFKQAYKVDYGIIRNLPVSYPLPNIKREPFILYQGAVNEGRCFEEIIPAMKDIPIPLVVCGDGNFMSQAKDLVKLHQVDDKVIFKGMLAPSELRKYTLTAKVGLNIIDSKGLNNYWSLTNRFFDYIQATLPQVTVNYPAYQPILQQYKVGATVNETSSSKISAAVNELLNNNELYQEIEAACEQAREELTWDNESKKLIFFFNSRVF